MKLIIQKLWMAMAILCLSISASAYDFEVDGFYYEVNLEEMTAAMVAGENKLTGEIIIPSSVTYKDRAFSVTSINGAFSGNDGLTKVTLPSTVNFLGSKTFNGCSKLVSVSPLNNIVELGESCFSGCEELATIIVSNELKTIGSRAFYGCKALKELIVPESVDSIGVEVFQNCINLSTVVLPSTFKYIPNGLFKNCESLVNLEIPSSITTINDEAFSGCKSLASIVIPANVKKIDNGVFNGCSSIKSVRIEDSEEALTLGYGRVTERRVLGLLYALPIENLYLGRNLDYPDNESLFLDAHYEGYAPFQSCPISEVTIGKSVNRINPYTFYNCPNLEEVSIPTSVNSIGVYAFAKSGIRDFTINDGYKNISLGVTENDDLTTLFMGCNHLKNIKVGRNCVVSEQKSQGWLVGNDLKIPSLFPQTIENIEIGNYVDELSWLQLYNGEISSTLSHYPNLQSLNIGCCIGYLPDLAGNLTLNALIVCSPNPLSVPTGTFSTSQYMDLSVIVPSGHLPLYRENEVWGKFWNLSESETLLDNITIHNNQLYGIIDDGAQLLKSPFGLTGKVVIPEFVEKYDRRYMVNSIGRAFKANYTIKEIEIQANIERIETDCFKGCTELETIKLNEGLLDIGSGAFYDCVCLSNVSLPSTLKSIGEYSFYNCKNLNIFSIPASVVSFGKYAFNKSVIQSLIFEEGDAPLELPSGSSTTKTIFDRGWSHSKYLCTWEGYFEATSIKSLYLGRNLIDHDIISGGGAYSGITFHRYNDPFYQIKDLKKLTIGHHVTRIGSDYHEEVTKDPSYPYTPYKIVNLRSFSNCNNLDSIQVESMMPPVGAEFSDHTYKYGNLVIPSGTKESFMNADGWKEFKYIVEEAAGVENTIGDGNSSMKISYDGIIFQGEYPAYVSIYGVDGKCQYSGNLSPGQFMALSKGIYIVILEGKSIKVKI